MKISTQFLFERASRQMSQVQARVVQSQAQVASGKQVLKPSDQPDQAALIQRYKSLIARHENYQSNMDQVKTRLQGESSTLESVVNLMHRAKELVVQATNDTNSPADRQSIATELQGIRDQVLSLANAQDTSGNYLFSGSRVDVPAFAPPVDDPNGSPIYQGDRSRMQVLIGDRRELPINRAGADVFVRLLRQRDDGTNEGVDFFTALDEMVQGVKDSDQAQMRRGNKELDAMLDGVTHAQAVVGTDLAVIDQQELTLQDTLDVLQSSLSTAEDLDYAKAITQMNKQMVSLEAAQSSFAKMSQLNLFNFLR